MSRKELTWSALSTLIFIVAIVVCLVGTVGCTEIKISESPRSLEEEVNETQDLELHDLSIPITGYDMNKVVTLELDCCEDCGFVPWTDSWCEFHYGT